MNDNIKVNNKEKELLEFMSKIILDSVDKNGTDILLGKFGGKQINDLNKEKDNFDKMCEKDIKCEPEMQITFKKYNLKEKEYYHIGIYFNKDSIDEEVDERNKYQVLHKKTKENDDANVKTEKVKITDRQMELLKLINNNPYIKYDEMRNILGISKGTISIDVKMLKNLKVLERIGTSDGKWEINKSLIDIC